MTARYAATTTVSSTNSRAEIEHDLERFGATSFQYGWDSASKRAVVAFTYAGRRIRLQMDLPPRDHPDVRYTPVRRTLRSADAQREAYEQLVRARWRALALGIRAKLALVAEGITTFEEEFLAYVLMPGTDTTVAQYVAPHVAQAYALEAAPPEGEV